MGGAIFFLGFIVLIVVIAGSICGIVAVSKIQSLVRELEDVKRQLRSLREEINKHERQAPIPAKEAASPPQPVPARAAEPLNSDSSPEGHGGSQSSYPFFSYTENGTGDASTSTPQGSVTVSGDEARDQMAKLGRYRDAACGYRLLSQICI